MAEFYSLNPKKMERYLPFMSERLRQSKRDISEIGWTNGRYVAQAIGASMSKSGRYPNEPIDFYGVQMIEDEETGERHTCTDADRFWAFASNVNASREIKAIDAKIAEERASKARSDGTESVSE